MKKNEFFFAFDKIEEKNGAENWVISNSGHVVGERNNSSMIPYLVAGLTARDLREGDIEDSDVREGDIAEGDTREADIRDGDIREGDFCEKDDFVESDISERVKLGCWIGD